MKDLFVNARRVSVPIVAIRTSDQFATQAMLVELVKDVPIIVWDAVNGLRPLMTSTGEQPKAVAALKGIKVPPEETVGFVGAMEAIKKLPQASLVFAHNAHRQLIGEPASIAAPVQAVANLRDLFKLNYRMLVMLAPSFLLPAELEQDVFMLDDPLPGPEALKQVIIDLHEGVKLAVPSSEQLDKQVEAVRGLSLYAAEQQIAVSFKADGLDTSLLWERKRVTIEQTRGLKVWRGKERFTDLIGLASVKAKLKSVCKAKTPVGVVIWIDEIDKVFANIEQDTTNVRMDQFRTFLTDMEDNEWPGLVGVGVPGGGKSLLAKAFANEAGVPNIQLDLGGMEGPHVGESEMMLRQAMGVIKAVGGGRAYIIATSNNATVMRPEMQRRFTDGFFFFDLMTGAERAATWAFYMKKYDLDLLKKQPLPDDSGWTGAEIRNCCRSAWNTDSTLVEAAQFIVPMATSRAKDIEELRQYAHGRFLDASKPGAYHYDPQPMVKQMRAITLPDLAALAMAGSIPQGRES